MQEAPNLDQAILSHSVQLQHSHVSVSPWEQNWSAGFNRNIATEKLKNHKTQGIASEIRHKFEPSEPY
jgi:uncharacterized protein YfaT (DUF1175 family)